MTTINHLNLAAPDVAALTHFFLTGFGFELAEQRGNGNFALLLGSDGFVLVLMHDKNAATRYPDSFHVGFVVPSTEAVHEHHDRLHVAGFQPASPAILQRGGDKSFGFYCNAAGGILVEVTTRPGLALT